ncbi:Hypothetical predicted protein [Octopus vulgaris]|uniref:Uncharacterized protein n=1 Tax=Octopus vulgaris TaxID=6645 RepID=A0AA36F7V5_OCTVU|nr:Hypothetical predicted protein [Octopus vulgaris]
MAVARTSEKEDQRRNHRSANTASTATARSSQTSPQRKRHRAANAACISAAARTEENEEQRHRRRTTYAGNSPAALSSQTLQDCDNCLQNYVRQRALPKGVSKPLASQWVLKTFHKCMLLIGAALRNKVLKSEEHCASAVAEVGVKTFSQV